jgi:glycosyltransferase involved in cell wall biosynthesis
MKILYDHQIFTAQKFGGISRYFFELMNHSKGLFEYDAPCVYSENLYLKPLRLYKEFPLKFYFKGKGRIINHLNKSNSIKIIKKKNYDIIHPTYYDPYLLKKLKIIPQKINFNLPLIRNEIQNNKENLKYNNQAILEYKLNPEKQNYILFTGQRSAYKNFGRFIEAVAPLLINYNLQLICTGQKFTKDENALLNQYKITEKTKSIFASENELQDLYSKALLFVFPSLYEGFGFPILEAFSSGCPAVLSNTSCFTEIAENAAIFFDPYSVDDMREKIEKVILDHSLQSLLIKKGFEQVKQFTWEKTVNQTYQLYSKLLTSHEKRLVITVYDMIHELFPECFSSKDKTSLNKYIMMLNANKIIAISHNTKTDILRFYPDIDEKKIDVIHLGNSFTSIISNYNNEQVM